MAYLLRIGAAASILLLAAACTKTTEITLPALDASETTMANALVVRTDYPKGFDAPSGIVRGAGEGAAKGMDVYSGAYTGSNEAWILKILLAPVVLPAAAAIGASAAHSEEEVDAAAAAFNRVGQDKELLASINQRFIEALNEVTAKQWTCLKAASTEMELPCKGNAPIARLTLRPTFGLRAIGDFDPDIGFLGDVVVVAEVDYATPSAKTDVVIKAKWAYREELGTFFALRRTTQPYCVANWKVSLTALPPRLQKSCTWPPARKNSWGRSRGLAASSSRYPKVKLFVLGKAPPKAAGVCLGLTPLGLANQIQVYRHRFARERHCNQ
jgi:hypothetical protein